MMLSVMFSGYYLPVLLIGIVSGIILSIFFRLLKEVFLSQNVVKDKISQCCSATVYEKKITTCLNCGNKCNLKNSEC